jgi:predicted aminopeptidase
VAANREAALWRDERRLDAFYAGLSERLTELYAAGLTGPALDGGRTVVFDSARTVLRQVVGPTLEVYDGEWLARVPLNNARVVAARIYRTRLALFDQVLEADGGDVRAAIRRIADAVRASPDVDPYEVLLALRVPEAVR